MIKNKKGWLKIVEAFIAVLIITSVLLVTIARLPEKDRTEEIHKMQRFVLNQVALNDTLRQEILDSDGEVPQTGNLINSIVPSHWNFKAKACGVEEVCKMDGYIEKNIYVDQILIASTLYEYDPSNPKILKLFVWED